MDWTREGANKSLIWDHVCHLEPWNRVHHDLYVPFVPERSMTWGSTRCHSTSCVL